jgi:hypothetical protein
LAFFSLLSTTSVIIALVAPIALAASRVTSFNLT